MDRVLDYFRGGGNTDRITEDYLRELEKGADISLFPLFCSKHDIPHSMNFNTAQAYIRRGFIGESAGERIILERGEDCLQYLKILALMDFPLFKEIDDQSGLNLLYSDNSCDSLPPFWLEGSLSNVLLLEEKFILRRIPYRRNRSGGRINLYLFEDSQEFRAKEEKSLLKTILYLDHKPEGEVFPELMEGMVRELKERNRELEFELASLKSQIENLSYKHNLPLRISFDIEDPKMRLRLVYDS